MTKPPFSEYSHPDPSITNPNYPATTPDTREAKGVNNQLELAIQRFANKTNEGNNAIICKIDIAHIPELAALQQLVEAAESKTESQAIKVLKVYQPGAGKREYEMQQHAYDIVQAAANQTGLALVPRPILFYDLQISPETLQRLNAMGITDVNDHVEILLMDYIEGDDIATMLLREAIKRNPQMHDIHSAADNMTFKELYEEISRLLFPAKKALSKWNTEQAQADIENAQTLYKFLKSKGFVLPPTILDQIEKTMTLFHKGGLCFRDGHYRNFMIQNKEVDGEIQPQVFVVDYGLSTTFEGEYSDELYFDPTKDYIKYPDDFNIIRTLRDLSETAEQTQQLESQKYLDEINRLRSKLKKTEEWQKIFAAKITGEIDLENLIDNLWNRVTLPTAPAKFISAVLLELSEQKLITKDQAKIYLQSKITAPNVFGEEATRNYLRNILKII